jgi:heterotetrameric sarcosine oxidase gamma subunit
MALQTKADIPFTSPLAHVLRGQTPAAFDAARDTVGLADLSGQTLTHIRSDNLESAFSSVPEHVGDIITSGESIIARLRGDGVLVIGDAADNLENSIGDSLLTVTDITHGRGHFLLIGKQTADILAKTCGLDFADSAFPNNHAAQSSLAKVTATIIRHDRNNMPAYHLIVGYSYAEYVWGVVFDAMGEFDGMYIA